VDVLQRPVWSLLLSRIGDAAMLHLLSHSFIFWPLANGCYLQLAGAPLYRCRSPAFRPRAARAYPDAFHVP
jgi:hypothetical protein